MFSVCFPPTFNKFLKASDSSLPLGLLPLSQINGKGFLRIRWSSAARRQLAAYLGISMLPTLVICDAGEKFLGRPFLRLL